MNGGSKESNIGYPEHSHDDSRQSKQNNQRDDHRSEETGSSSKEREKKSRTRLGSERKEEPVKTQTQVFPFPNPDRKQPFSEEHPRRHLDPTYELHEERAGKQAHSRHTAGWPRPWRQ